MEAIFDNAAATYDSSFTNSHTGRMQRARVWQFLKAHVLRDKPMDILEVNCGTGEDAIHLANEGNRVIATDISENMIKAASLKKSVNNVKGELTFQKSDIISTFKNHKPRSFDLIFSNFGGFNCLSPQELKEAVSLSANLLKKGGSLVAVVMPRACLQESVYFYLKSNKKKARRRRSVDGASANIEGEEMTTYYYDYQFFRDFTEYKIERNLAVGFFLPPSYLEPFYQPKKVLMKSMYSLEKLIKPFQFLSNYSDHYFIQLSKAK